MSPLLLYLVSLLYCTISTVSKTFKAKNHEHKQCLVVQGCCGHPLGSSGPPRRWMLWKGGPRWKGLTQRSEPPAWAQSTLSAAVALFVCSWSCLAYSSSTHTCMHTHTHTHTPTCIQARTHARTHTTLGPLHSLRTTMWRESSFLLRSNLLQTSPTPDLSQR